jgi:hypothetical protein
MRVARGTQLLFIMISWNLLLLLFPLFLIPRHRLYVYSMNSVAHKIRSAAGHEFALLECAKLENNLGRWRSFGDDMQQIQD